MVSEAFPQQPQRPGQVESAPKQRTSVLEKISGAYGAVKERFTSLVKRTPREVPESFRAAAAMETKIQEQVGRTIRTADDEVRERTNLARQAFMDRLEGVNTKGMRRELAKLEGHLETLAKGKTRVEASIGTQTTTAQLDGMLKNLQYYYDSIEEVQERIRAIRRKQEQPSGFSFFRKAESL